MSALATPVRRPAIGPAWTQTMLVHTSVGHVVGGLLLADGARVLTAGLGLDPVCVTPAFPDMASTPGDWPIAVSGRPRAGALALLDLAIPQPAPQAVPCAMPRKRQRALAPLRLADGRSGWAMVTIVGAVPRACNRTASPLYVASLSGAAGPLPPGTPVFRLDDGACLGLLVPDTGVTMRLSTPLCVVAAVEEPTGSPP